MRHGGPSMVAPLRRVLVGTPRVAGWGDPRRAGGWKDLGYAHMPSAGAADEEHAALRLILSEAGAGIVELPPGGDLGLDAIYTHDASLVTDGGAIILRMGKPARAAEPAWHAALYRSLGVPILGEIRAPGTAEGGDLLWLDARTLLAGRGYRTNGDGIGQLRGLLSPSGAEVVEAPLPHGAGPGSCLHLQSLVSLLDDRTALVDLPWLSVPTVELLRRRIPRLIEIDPGERATQACNVLSLGQGRLVALEDNARTNDRLRQAGFEVRTIRGREIAHNGGGGPTCLTRPLLRGTAP